MHCLHGAGWLHMRRRHCATIGVCKRGALVPIGLILCERRVMYAGLLRHVHWSSGIHHILVRWHVYLQRRLR